MKYGKYSLDNRDKYYSSLSDIPAYNWFKVCDGDLKYLLKDMDNKLDFHSIGCYEQIKDDLIDMQGISKEKELILKKEIQIIHLKAAMYGKGVLVNSMLIKIAEKELEVLKEEKPKVSVVDNTLLLESYVGRLDLKQISAEEYFKKINGLPRIIEIHSAKNI